MDGVTGLTQPGIQPGKTFVYEFIAKRPGTFMYHPHADEMTQMAMGMMGFWVTHPKDPKFMPVDRDFVFLLNAYDEQEVDREGTGRGFDLELMFVVSVLIVASATTLEVLTSRSDAARRGGAADRGVPPR